MVQFATRMNNLKGSAIRELLALANKPEIISFAGGMPAPELFPVDKVRAAADAVLTEEGRIALQYTSTDGWPRLREQIAERMGVKNKIKTDAAHILMTSGSQQGLDYSARVFLNPGDVVLMESPSYLGAINAFKTCEPTFIDIPTDKDGMIMEELEKVLKTTKNVKMIYVIPDFQNPSGRTWPLERRQKFMEIINKYEIPVIEDNPYGELRYEGDFLPALKSMDTKGLVVFLGTFSKILAPGYRLGWVCADDEILQKYNFMAQAAALQASTIGMMEVSKFIDMFDLDEHVNTIRECYARRCKLMVDTMEKTFPKEVTFTRPKGGLFTWAELPEYIDTKEMAKQALAQNVAYVPGEGFFPNGGNHHCMRLNYSNMPDDRIVKGITILADVIKQNLR
jgi:2-aminoadipate transaminase